MAGEDPEPGSRDNEKQAPAQQERPQLQLPAGTVVKNRWKLTSKIGQGAFGETYAGFDINGNQEQQVAIKVERWDSKKMVLKLEVMALKKLQPCSLVVRYISSGRQDDFNFLVMERLGENLAELRKKTVDGTFTMATTMRLGIQMLDAIEGCHNLSYIHRDIKPSNFVIGRTESTRRKCYLIDFGLARKYRMPGGDIRPPRKTAGFRGTARYASIQSHQSKELGRRDDLWSLFYVLIEFATGSLPWRKIKDKDQIGVLKEKHNTTDLVQGLPSQFASFMDHLLSLNYTSTPDYSALRNMLISILDDSGIPLEGPLDWERDQASVCSNRSNRGSKRNTPVPQGSYGERSHGSQNNRPAIPETVDTNPYRSDHPDPPPISRPHRAESSLSLSANRAEEARRQMPNHNDDVPLMERMYSPEQNHLPRPISPARVVDESAVFGHQNGYNQTPERSPVRSAPKIEIPTTPKAPEISPKPVAPLLSNNGISQQRANVPTSPLETPPLEPPPPAAQLAPVSTPSHQHISTNAVAAASPSSSKPGKGERDPKNKKGCKCLVM